MSATVSILNPPLKVRQHFQNLQPPSKEIKEINMLVKNSLHAIYMVKHSLIFVCKLLYQNVYDFVKRHVFLLLLLAKSADISTLDTPLPLMSATVSIFRTPPSLKNADVLYGWPLILKFVALPFKNTYFFQ